MLTEYHCLTGSSPLGMILADFFPLYDNDKIPFLKILTSPITESAYSLTLMVPGTY